MRGRYCQPFQKGIRLMYGLKIYKCVLKRQDRNLPSRIPSTTLNAGGIWEVKIEGSRQAHMLYLIAFSIVIVWDRIVC